MAAHTSDSAGAPLLGRLETLTVVGIIGVLALALGLAGLALRGPHAVTKKIGYTQSGSFDYSASAPPSSAYGGSGLSTGDPILTKVVGPVQTTFAYRFAAGQPAKVHGSAGLVAKVTLGSGLSKTFDVASQEPFNGTKTTVAGRLPVSKITSYVTTAQRALGDTGGDSAATVTVQPDVHLAGALGGHTLKTSYAPSLPFTLSGNTLTISSGDSASPSASSSPADALKPSTKGAISYRATEPATVPILVAHPSTTVAIGVGFGVALICLLLGLWLARPLWGASDDATESSRIRALYGGQLVQIRALSLPAGPVADVASMSALAELAKKYESMVMHLSDETGDSYLVWDQGMTYRYRPDGVVAPAPVADSHANGHRAAPQRSESPVPPSRPEQVAPVESKLAALRRTQRIMPTDTPAEPATGAPEPSREHSAFNPPKTPAAPPDAAPADDTEATPVADDPATAAVREPAPDTATTDIPTDPDAERDRLRLQPVAPWQRS